VLALEHAQLMRCSAIVVIPIRRERQSRDDRKCHIRKAAARFQTKSDALNANWVKHALKTVRLNYRSKPLVVLQQSVKLLVQLPAATDELSGTCIFWRSRVRDI